MEMEVAVAVPPPVDFNFDSNCSSPYITAPSSPQRFGSLFFSAPTSPARVSAFLHQLNHLAITRHSSAAAASSAPPHSHPISETTGNAANHNDDNEDFEFNFSGHLQRASLSADELFDGGKIRPLNLSSPASNASSPRARTSQGKKIVQGEFEEGKRESEGAPQQQKRGRQRASSSCPSSLSPTPSGRKGSRSLSPLRASVSDTACGSVSSSTSNPKSSATSSYASFLSSISFAKGYRKWRFKDFLLFRSASEGRGADKDPLRKKYAVLSKTAADEDVRNSSFRTTESSGSVSGRRGPVSAHELHYTVNRAASEEMKKKTFLPYKQGLLGCLGFNPGMNQIRRGIGSLARS